MARLHTSFVLGYHGCTADVGESVLSGASQLRGSNQDYDWLGPGTYFWEADPMRAWEWAKAKVAREKSGTPFVIGAIIDLGNCLDLMARESLELLEETYQSFRNTTEKADFDGELPVNKVAGPNDQDLLLRYLDCAVIKHLHAAIGEVNRFDTVRGLFTEGEPLFEGSGFKRKTHVQLAVRTPDCIKGIFRVPSDEFVEAG